MVSPSLGAMILVHLPSQNVGMWELVTEERAEAGASAEVTTTWIVRL